jgi:hypothetical protein
MKPVMISALAAAALMLGACTHMAGDTAALSPDQIHAELASISKALADVAVMSKEDQRRMTAQNKASAMALGLIGRGAGSDGYGRKFEGPIAVMPVNTARPLDKRERLLQRQIELRAALAAVTRRGS